MKVELDISDYDKNIGFKSDWHGDFTIDSKINDGVIHIRANKDGLISLAKQMLAMANDTVPIHTHLHYDDYSLIE